MFPSHAAARLHPRACRTCTEFQRLRLPKARSESLIGTFRHIILTNTDSISQLGVSGFIEQFANDADLATFLRGLRPDLEGTTFALQTLDGGENPQNQNEAGVEADLDIQYTVGVASGVPVTFISVGEQTHDGAVRIIKPILNEDHNH